LRYPARRDRYRIGRVQIHAIGGGAFWGGRAIGASLLKLWRDALLEIRREHRRARFDAIIGIWATESGWLATRAGKMLGVPTLVHLAGGELTWIPRIKYGNRGRGLAGRLVTATLRSADMLTAPSLPMKQALLSHRHVPPDKVRSWALGVDTDMFSPAERVEPDRPFTFVTVGSLVPVKGHDLLLRSMATLRRIAPHTEIRLRIVGTGPLKAHLDNLADQLGLAGYVDFVGEVAHEQLPAVHRAADCFVIASWHEAQCMAALEAMACGLPWVAPPVGAFADLARASTNQPTGLLVTQRTSEAFAHAMLNMATQPVETMSAWGHHARSGVEAEYDLQTQTARLLHNVEALTGGRHHS
jgi:glycosyltransferase involved in cell wall biosynthesis